MFWCYLRFIKNGCSQQVFVFTMEGVYMKNRRDVVRLQKLALLLLGMAVIIIISCFLFSSIKTQAAPAEITYKYYTSVEIQSGDTLWTIAQDYYTEEYTDLNEYIYEVCELNHISSDEIHAGQYITVPYYATVARQ